jgi:glucokinase
VTVLAIDLGGTQMRAAIVAADGTIERREVRRTPREDERPDALVALMKELASGATRAIVGLPGRIDHALGRLEHAPNLPSTWPPFLTEERLCDAVGRPVHLANDADLAAVGEGYFGAGRPYEDLVYITVSTGIGGGVLLKDKVVRGHHSLAEIGHTVIDLTAALEGKPSTFEELASATGVARFAEAVGISGGSKEVVERVRAGDPLARKVLDRATEALAVGVANVAFCFSPQAVVLGGGLGLVGDLLYEPVRKWLQRRGPPGLTDPIVVVGAALGDDAGLVGAAAWAQATAP